MFNVHIRVCLATYSPLLLHRRLLFNIQSCVGTLQAKCLKPASAHRVTGTLERIYFQRTRIRILVKSAMNAINLFAGSQATFGHRVAAALEARIRERAAGGAASRRAGRAAHPLSLQDFLPNCRRHGAHIAHSPHVAPSVGKRAVRTASFDRFYPLGIIPGSCSPLISGHS